MAGRFPEVLRNFFGWEPWSDSTRYFVAPMGQLTVEPEAVVGRITFESLTSRDIPLIVYGVGLTADEIEATAHAGAMWLQLEPTDGYKLLGAIRGVLRAS